MKYSTGNCADLNIALALQEGVYIELPEMVALSTVSGFICHLLAVSPDVMAAEIKTIMLNNQVVDDPATTVLSGGDTLILSGAMPGLVGAMLRSDSPIGVMRAGITAGKGSRAGHGDSESDLDSPVETTTRRVRIKLFNTLLKKYRARLLEYGFYLKEAGT